MATPDPRVSAAAQGDRRAAESLLAEILPRVRNLVRYLMRGDDIDDVVQEALVAIVRGFPTYRGDGTFTSWADRIVARVAIAMAQTQRKRQALPLDESDVAGGTRPDEFAQRRNAVAMLDQLPNDLRNALVLHHVLEMTVPEIARELGVPMETIRSRLRIAKGRMREKLASKPDEEPAEVPA